MIYEDFVEELRSAGISGREFARLLRLNVNTVSGYKKRGTVPSNLAAVAALMRLLKEHGVPYKETLEALDIAPNARRGISIAKL